MENNQDGLSTKYEQYFPNERNKGKRKQRKFIISTVKRTRCTNVSSLFYFGMTLYMFRTVFQSIIRSSRLYIQQQAYVKQILVSAC